jgi:hypothetical protein
MKNFNEIKTILKTVQRLSTLPIQALLGSLSLRQNISPIV